MVGLTFNIVSHRLDIHGEFEAPELSIELEVSFGRHRFFRYDHETRRFILRESFEKWINGLRSDCVFIRVMALHDRRAEFYMTKECYMIFTDPVDAMMFKLEWLG